MGPTAVLGAFDVESRGRDASTVSAPVAAVHELCSKAEDVSVKATDVFGSLDVESLCSNSATNSTPIVADQDRKPSAQKHPWPLTVYYLDRAIRKLRQVKAKSDAEDFAKQTTLWRGIKNKTVDIERLLKLAGALSLPQCRLPRIRTSLASMPRATCLWC